MAISQVRSARPRQRHHVVLDDTILDTVACTAGVDPAGTDDGIRQLYALIDRLDAFNRALALLYLDERSQREIAEILGISESNVGTRIHRLKQRLRAELG